MSKMKSMSGKIYGDFFVTNEHKSVNGKTYWKCICNTCMNEKWFIRSNMLNNIGSSCKVCRKAQNE